MRVVRNPLRGGARGGPAPAKVWLRLMRLGADEGGSSTVHPPLRGLDVATVTWTCAACGKKFKASAGNAGRTARCTGCGASTTVPGDAAPAAPAAARPVRVGWLVAGTAVVLMPLSGLAFWAGLAT